MHELFSLDDEVYDLWNLEKKALNKKERIVHPKPRDIWYIKIGINVGRELFGKKGFFRPVLVISQIGNMCFCIPMTTKSKHPEYTIPLPLSNGSKESYLVVNQGRVFDAKRFCSKKGRISDLLFEQIKKTSKK